MKKVCILSSVHKWDDIRIFKKQAVSLAKAGFEVHYIVPTNVSGEHSGVFIHPIDIPVNRANRFLNTREVLFKKAKEIKAEIYHIHDPELIPIANKLKKTGAKIIYDSHEDVPADILDKEWISFSIIRKVVSHAFNFYEKKVTSKFDAVISVSENITNKFKAKRCLTIRNLPLLSSFKVENKRAINTENRRVVYAGGLTRVRNIKEMIQSVKYISHKNTSLHIFGGFDDPTYEKECKDLEEWGLVKYHGLQDSKVVYDFMNTCALGLILFKKIPNHEYAIPNKAFEYMAAGLPLLISNISFWKEQFASNAFFVDPENPEAVGNKITAILSDIESLNLIADYNKKLVKSTMNWENESLKLIELYKSL